MDSLIAVGGGAVLKQILTELLKLAGKGAGKVYSGWLTNEKINEIKSAIYSLDKISLFIFPDETESLTGVYYPLRIKFHNSLYEPTYAHSLRDIPGSGHFIIRGVAGKGKSFLMRRLCISEVSENKERSTGRLPIFVELKSIRKDRKFEDVIDATMRTYGFLREPGESFESLAKTGKLVLLLDGFDEISKSETFEVCDAIDNYLDKYKTKMQIIISTRPGAEIFKNNKFNVIDIEDVGYDKMGEFLLKINLSKSKVVRIMDIAEKSPVDVKLVLTTPLLMTLFAKVYLRPISGPSDLQDFYKKIFHTFFWEHDSRKYKFERTYESGVQCDELERMFRAFCYYALALDFPACLTRECFEEAFMVARERCLVGCSFSNFAKDILTTCLMLQEGDIFRFSHDTIQEYYASDYIRSFEGVRGRQAYRFLATIKNNISRWQQVLNFLSHIDKLKYNKYYLHPIYKDLLSSVNALKGITNDDCEFMIVNKLADSVLYVAKDNEDRKKIIGIDIKFEPLVRVNDHVGGSVFEVAFLDSRIWDFSKYDEWISTTYNECPCKSCLFMDAVSDVGPQLFATILRISIERLCRNYSHVQAEVKKLELGAIDSPSGLQDL